MLKRRGMLTRRGMLANGLVAAASLPLSMGRSAKAQTPPRKRLIVDSQIHLWKANTPDRPWAPGTSAQIPEPMTIERVLPLLEEGGVDRIVIVPPTLEGLRYDYGQEAARRFPGRFATMARVDLDNPKEAERLPALRREPAVLGVRLFFAGDLAKGLVDGKFDWFWPAVEAAGLPVMFLTNGQTPLFAAIAQRHPALTLIIDHMGVSSTVVANNAVAATIAESVALAKYPNVSIKLSASPLVSRESYPFRDVADPIHRLYDAYGPQRCYWGTDVTNSFDKCTYKQRVTHFTEELAFLSEDDKDWIMGRAILQRLGWA